MNGIKFFNLFLLSVKLITYLQLICSRTLEWKPLQLNMGYKIPISKKDRRFIDRKYHTKKPCGYCWMIGHRGYLTVQLMKEHQCLQKRCPHFQLYKEHSYWEQLEREKQLKEERKRLKNEERSRRNNTIGA